MATCVVTLTVDDGNELVEFAKMLNLATIPRVGEHLWIVADEEEIGECFEVTQIMHRFDYSIDGCPAIVVCCDESESILVITKEKNDILIKTGWHKEDVFTFLSKYEITRDGAENVQDEN